MILDDLFKGLPVQVNTRFSFGHIDHAVYLHRHKLCLIDNSLPRGFFGALRSLLPVLLVALLLLIQNGLPGIAEVIIHLPENPFINSLLISLVLNDISANGNLFLFRHIRDQVCRLHELLFTGSFCVLLFPCNKSPKSFIFDAFHRGLHLTHGRTFCHGSAVGSQVACLGLLPPLFIKQGNHLLIAQVVKKFGSIKRIPGTRAHHIRNMMITGKFHFIRSQAEAGFLIAPILDHLLLPGFILGQGIKHGTIGDFLPEFRLNIIFVQIKLPFALSLPPNAHLLRISWKVGVLRRNCPAFLNDLQLGIRVRLLLGLIPQHAFQFVLNLEQILFIQFIPLSFVHLKSQLGRVFPHQTFGLLHQFILMKPIT